jgi:alpha-2-macroglobulin
VRTVTLVLVWRLGVIAKTARRQGLVWAVDAVSGQPQPKTDVLVQRHIRRNQYEYERGAVDDSGLYHLTYREEKRRYGRQLAFIVRHGDHYAMCRDMYQWGWWGYQYPYRIYGFTERPVYRPEQTVRFKEIVRKHDEGRYENAPDEAVTVRIRDPRGKVVYDRSLRTNEDGSLSGELKLGAEPPLGVYRIEVEIGKRTYNPWECLGNQFRVEEYKKPEFKVEVAPAKPSYRVGDEIEIDIKAKYYFGQPVAGADVEYEVWRSEFHSTYQPPRPYPWYYKAEAQGVRRGWIAHRRQTSYPWHMGRRRELVTRGKAVTDERGVARVGPIKTKPYEKNPEVDLQYEVTARVVDQSRREIRGAGSVKVTHAPFFIHLRPQRYLYKPGDNAQIDIVTKGPNGNPIAFDGTAKIHRLRTKRVEKDGREWTEYELGKQIHQAKVKVGKDGRGRLRYPFDEEGLFRVIVSTKTEAGDEVTGSCDVWIAERGGEFAHYAYRDVELVLDRDSYEIGQTMRVLINTRHKDGYILLTAETDELLLHKIVFVKGKSALVELPVGRQFTPNFYLLAMTLRDDKVYEDRRQVIVPPTHQFLTVEAKPDKLSYRPREKGKVVIKAKDSAGKPVQTELAVMMVDASVYYIQPEFRKQIQEYFYGQLRPLTVKTQSSFAYRQHGYGREFKEAAVGKQRLRSLGYAGDAAAESAARAPAPAAAPMLAKAKGAPGRGMADEEAPAVREAMVRKEFADSVVWMAHVKTDADGHATVDVPMPDNLTTWKLHAVACDRQTRVGEQSIEVVTKKNLIVRLETPRFLVEKDLVYVSAIVHNYLKTGKKARVELKVTPQLQITDAISEAKDLALDGSVKTPTLYRRWIEVPPDAEVRVDFVCQARSPGEATLLAKALTDEESDAMELKLPVLEFGADKFLAQAAYMGDVPDGECALNISVPTAIKPNSQTLDVRTNPSVAAVMIDALPYLLAYPYGCTEQTLSRFVPAVVTAKSLQKLGISLEDVRKKIEQQGGPENKRQLLRLHRNPVFNTQKMNAMIAKGIKRLADMQHGDGGWGWWKHDESNPYMTAYAVYALAEARAADVSFDPSMLKRGVEFLKKRVTSVQPVGRYRWARDDDNVRAWMLFALACENPGNVVANAKVREVLDRVYKDRDGLTDYGRAMLAIVLAKVGDRNRAVVLIENFDNTARIDRETQTASWGRVRGWWWWYDSGLETTAMVLRAYLAVEPKHKYIPMIIRWLVRNRQGSRWYSTKDTAQCVYALAEYLQASGELDPDMTVEVVVDGKLRNRLRITKANVLAVDASTLIGPDGLAPGPHTIKIHKRGRGYLYVSSYLRYYTREDPIKGAGHEVTVARKYIRLVPKEVEKTRAVWDRKQRKHVTEKYKTIQYDRVEVRPGEELPSGTLLEVCLQIEAKNNFEYLLFEDPKPAGCEPVDLVSGSTYGGGTYANMELRDERVVFFATYLSQGVHKLAYRLRCEIPGTFNALPTRAEAMYTPFVRAISDSDRMAVVERK